MVYHGLHFATINPAAFGFAVLFVMQAALFLCAGGVRRRLSFGHATRPASVAGIGLVAYAAVVYPLVGALAGHTYPQTPLFGVTPCPVTIFTLGLLLLANAPVPWFLLPIPVVWSLVGGSAAILLDVPQDWPLLASGPLAAGWIAMRDKPWRARRSAAH